MGYDSRIGRETQGSGLKFILSADTDEGKGETNEQAF